MSKLIKQVWGALLVLCFSVQLPVMAENINLVGAKFGITRVGSMDLGGPFLIFIDANSSGCKDGDWSNALMVPRSLPNFNEMVSLATAAMLAGKKILVWTGSAFWDKSCGDGFGAATGNTTGIARISRLDVIN